MKTSHPLKINISYIASLLAARCCAFRHLGVIPVIKSAVSKSHITQLCTGGICICVSATPVPLTSTIAFCPFDIIYQMSCELTYKLNRTIVSLLEACYSN
jgi:hypothetical protein